MCCSLLVCKLRPLHTLSALIQTPDPLEQAYSLHFTNFQSGLSYIHLPKAAFPRIYQCFYSFIPYARQGRLAVWQKVDPLTLVHVFCPAPQAVPAPSPAVASSPVRFSSRSWIVTPVTQRSSKHSSTAFIIRQGCARDT